MLRSSATDGHSKRPTNCLGNCGAVLHTSVSPSIWKWFTFSPHVLLSSKPKRSRNHAGLLCCMRIGERAEARGGWGRGRGRASLSHHVTAGNFVGNQVSSHPPPPQDKTRQHFSSSSNTPVVVAVVEALITDGIQYSTTAHTIVLPALCEARMCTLYTVASMWLKGHST